jgi:hypothetical protein
MLHLKKRDFQSLLNALARRLSCLALRMFLVGDMPLNFND